MDGLCKEFLPNYCKICQHHFLTTDTNYEHSPKREREREEREREGREREGGETDRQTGRQTDTDTQTETDTQTHRGQYQAIRQ